MTFSRDLSWGNFARSSKLKRAFLLFKHALYQVPDVSQSPLPSQRRFLPTIIDRADVLSDKSWNSTRRSVSIARVIKNHRMAGGWQAAPVSQPLPLPHRTSSTLHVWRPLERLGIGWTMAACFNAAWLERFHIRPQKGGPPRR